MKQVDCVVPYIIKKGGKGINYRSSLVPGPSRLDEQVTQLGVGGGRALHADEAEAEVADATDDGRLDNSSITESGWVW